MSCAIVLYFDQPFSEVDDHIGLTKAAEIRMASSSPRDDILVLVTRGFKRIPRAAISRLAELRYRVVNVEAIAEDVRRKYDFAREPRIWRNDPFHEACFLRWLVLEEFFGDSPVLAVDSDIVWRVDPYPLLEAWKSGGSFLCFKSCCLTFVKDRGWYEVYKSGLQRLYADPSFGSDYSRRRFTGIYHDQALFQYLLRDGELLDDPSNFLGHGFAERFFFTSNPIGIQPKRGQPPFKFEQTAAAETVDGRVVPFWHMQGAFSRYLFLALFVPAFIDRSGLRIPFEGSSHDEVTVGILRKLHFFLKKGEITFHNKKHKKLRALTNRVRQYEEFFNGDLAREIFREETWWKPGVWSSRPGANTASNRELLELEN